MSYKMQIFPNFKMMAKRFVLILLCTISVASAADAQQKKPLKVPPIKKPKQVTYPAPPPPKVKALKSAPPEIMQMGAPMVSVSPAEARYERDKMCSDCDTLVLEPNKKHILLYDIKWMSSRENRTYNEQPKASDLNKSYYALSGENKREWEELKANFPESEFSYHHIYRNTYIQTPNKSKQVLNLLNRQDRHEGFLYWSGKESDSTIKRTNMVLLTEIVSKQTGINKRSSYYQKFVKDSLSVVNYQKTKSPSANIAANMNFFLLDEVVGEKMFPIQFFDIGKVSKMTIQSQTEERKKVVFKLNTNGQLTEVIERDEALTITYKDNLPATIKEGSRIKNIYYQGDTVIFKDDNYLRLYKQVGKMFFNLKTYLIADDNYSKMTLDNGFENVISTKNNICWKSYNDERESASTDCYSNTNWQLPLNVSQNYTIRGHDYNSKISYSKVADKFVAESVNQSKSNKIEYTLMDNRPTLITSTTKRDDAEYGKPYLLNVTYEYHK